jgi:hypothetical protein
VDNKIVFSEVRPDEFDTIRIIKYRHLKNERERFRYMLIDYFSWCGHGVFTDLSNEFNQIEPNDFESKHGKILWSNPICDIRDIYPNTKTGGDVYFDSPSFAALQTIMGK